MMPRCAKTFSIGVMFMMLLGIVGCASGPKFSTMTLPALPAGQSRLIFYRTGNPFGGAIQPDVKLNGEVVGKSQPGSFFFVDRPAGKFEVATSTEAEHALSVATIAGDVRYIRTFITVGVFVGQVWPELVETDKALSALKDCSYIGPPLPNAPSK